MHNLQEDAYQYALQTGAQWEPKKYNYAASSEGCDYTTLQPAKSLEGSTSYNLVISGVSIPNIYIAFESSWHSHIHVIFIKINGSTYFVPVQNAQCVIFSKTWNHAKTMQR